MSAGTRLDKPKLKVLAKEFFAGGLAGRSRTSYSSAQRRYLNFCAVYNLSPLPLSEYCLSLFAAFLAYEGLQPQSISAYLSALRHLQISAGLDAVDRSQFPRLQYILKGISRSQPSNARARLPITGEVMRVLLRAWSSGLEKEFEARLLWAAACLAFFGFMRSGEFTVPNLRATPSITAADVELIPPAAPSMIRVFLRRAKTDPFGKGVNIFLGHSLNEICPVTALSNYLTRRPQRGQGPLFIHEDGSPLLKAQFVKKVKKALAHQNIDSSKYSGHSFRIGAATTAAAAGVPDHMIKMMGRWESSAYPPFCTGEARPLRGTSRREVGHGNLAQRGLKGMIPDDCPYTVRVVSEVLESNGSSSMATVCAGTMALMDAGVQMTRPVSGIAMGLISDGDRYAVLSDILGDEDHLGDMDFKVTGTYEGITACQMDIKVKGLSYEILVNALKQARNGRLHILDKLTETITTPNAEVKDHAPKMINRRIPNDMIGAFIGPGGKHIQELQKETGTTIVITEDAVTEEGIIEILGTDPAGIEQVIARIESMLFKPTVGSAYEVKVIKMLDFGAVVEYVEAPGNEVLLHVSELAWERTENVSDVVNMGDVFDVKYFGLDPRTRKEKVSRKALLPKPEGYVARPPRDDKRSGGRDNRSRDNRGRDDRKPRAPRKEA